MGFSSCALEQREKEAEALKSFLAFSLIGSLALHIGVLTFGVGNLLTRVPKLQEKPMEVTPAAPRQLAPPQLALKKPHLSAAPSRSQQQQPRSAPPATSSQRSLLESLRHQQKSPPAPKPDNSAPSGANQ